MLNELMDCLNRVQLHRDRCDIWSWNHTRNGVYSTNVAYSVSNLPGISTKSSGQQKAKAFKLLWRSFAPRRAQAICWKKFHERLPIKAKNIIPMNGDFTYMLCGASEEDIHHLLFSCQFVFQVWDDTFCWLKCQPVSIVNSDGHFSRFCNQVADRKLKRIATSIWIGVAWTIWKCRNETIFDNIVPILHKVPDELKGTLWSWGSVKFPNVKTLSFSAWLSDPLICCGSIPF